MITEILTAPYGTFTVNTSVAKVDIPYAGQIAFRDVNGNSAFTSGDTVNVLSAGYIVPGNFLLEQAGVAYTAGLIPFGIRLLQYPNTTVGAITTWMPFSPYEMSLDTFFNPKGSYQYHINTLVENYTVPQISASMLGVSSAWNGVQVELLQFIKIQHNTALS